MADSLDLTFQVGEGTSDTFIVELEAVNVKTLFTTQANDGSTDGILGAGDGSTDDAGVGASANGLVPINDDGANPSSTGDIQYVGDSIYLDASANDKRGDLMIDTASTTGNQANSNDYRNFIQHVDLAISRMNSNMNNVGINQRSLSGKEVNLTESITANSAAKSRIMDTDFAKEQSNSIRLQILQQTATAALSQANMGPQAVLGFLG
jgi:flagellin